MSSSSSRSSSSLLSLIPPGSELTRELAIADEKEAQDKETLRQQLEEALSLQERQRKSRVKENLGPQEGSSLVVESNEGPSSVVEPNEGGSQQVVTSVVARAEKPLLPSIGPGVNDSRMTLARFQAEFQKLGTSKLRHDWHSFTLPVSATR